MKLPKEINILGTTYKIIYETSEQNEQLLSSRGYCEFYTKEIYINKILFEYPKLGESQEIFKDLYKLGFEVIRHEAIHAFLFESGLWNNNDWARNEEMTDFFALQIPKICKSFEEIGVLIK